MNRRLLGIVPVGAHPERPAGNEQHSRRMCAVAPFDRGSARDRFMKNGLR
jgi:hypothetical protein